MAPSSTIWVTGRPEQDQRKEDWPVRRISAGYLQTLEARFVRGRGFTEAEAGSLAPVIIVNGTAAARYFPGEDPIGRTIALGGSESLARQIVGVVADLTDGPPDAPPHPAAYVPLDQSNFNLVVRTSLSEQALVPMLASAIRDLKSDAALGTATMMADRLARLPSTSLRWLSAWLIAMFATVAFALSIAGLYGVVSYVMGRRRREIGVRMALGARRAAVYRLMFAEVATVVAPATILGLIAAVGAAQAARGLLFDVPSWDPAVLAAAALALVSSAFLATYVAARGATSVSPVEALRPE
jgi:macrolide transport system ATP-binding/permease protein